MLAIYALTVLATFLIMYKYVKPSVWEETFSLAILAVIPVINVIMAIVARYVFGVVQETPDKDYMRQHFKTEEEHEEFLRADNE